MLGTINSTASVINDIQTDQEYTGIGETDPALMFTGESQQTVLTVLKYQLGPWVDLERLAIVQACNLDMIPIYQFLLHAYPPFYGASVTNTYEWFRFRMRSNSVRVHLKTDPGPTTFDVRLLEEDVPYFMVPLEGLEHMLKIRTPTISKFIYEANQILG